MPHNVKLLIAYDGTGYLGWQKTKMGASVESSLQLVLEKILQQPIRLQAASRTDAGVHAEGQTVNFMIDRPIDCLKLRCSLNCLLPRDIIILEATEEDEGFHPTLDVVLKEYHYLVCFNFAQRPRERLHAWHFPHSLAVNAMRLAASSIVGTHDFAAFCNLKSEGYDNTTRHVAAIDIEELPEKSLRIVVKGANFLYKMVRNIVGTLVYVGCGRLSPDSIPRILNGLDRTQAGVTAPAHGLTLHKVYY